MTFRSPLLFALLSALPVTFACHGPGAARTRILEVPGGGTLTPAELAERLAAHDVVFLGEEHDSDEVHALQLELTRRLADLRPALAVSLEMFERDVQPTLDLYLSGAIDEATFLGRARPWPNYERHYRAVVEFAKERGIPVLAANCPRPLAARVAREGLASVAGDPFGARTVDAPPGPYRDLFFQAMEGHGGGELDVERMYAAQCLKDDTMAESISRHLEASGEPRPLVVHWCGKFHSDQRLGTVSRLARRAPDLSLAVVTTRSTRHLAGAPEAVEIDAADYVLRVKTRN